MPKDTAAALFHKAHLFMAARNADTAYPLILRAERHYMVQHNDTLLYFTRYLKADILYDKLLYKNALPVYRSLIKLGSIYNLPLLPEAHMGLGSMYFRESKFDSALYHFRYVEQLKQYPVSEQLLSALYFNMASCYQYREEYAQAEAYHFKSLALKERLKDSLGIASAYLNMGDLYFDEYKDDTAAYYLEKCLEMATRLNNFQLLESANYNLFKVNQSRQQYKEALAHLEQSLAYKDSIWNRDKVWKIADQQKKFEVQQKQVEILKLENEKIVKDAEIKTRTQQRNTTLVGTLCLLMFTGFGIVAYNNKSRANRKIMAQNKIIDEQNNQKAVLLGEIHHRVKNNLEMLQSMLILQMRQYRDDESVQQALTEANNRIQSIALLHKQLYNGNLANTSAPEYFGEMFARIMEDSNARRQIPIKYNLDIIPVSFTPDYILPLALLINEWITNSIKYAFSRKQEDALIRFSLKKDLPSGKLEVIFADNGQNTKNSETTEGFGSRLINSLVRQLKGQLEISKNETGWQYRLTLDHHG
jgi:two-component sensor histidine kinase